MRDGGIRPSVGKGREQWRCRDEIKTGLGKMQRPPALERRRREAWVSARSRRGPLWGNLFCNFSVVGTCVRRAVM